MRPVLRDVLRKAGFTFLVVLFAGALVFLGFIYPHPAPVILMYHSITPDTHNNIGLPEGVFTSQLAFLSRHGYKIVPLSSLVKRIKEGLSVPHGWVALTFDDGFEDFYNHVYPLILKERIPVTLFIYVHGVSEADKLSWEQLVSLDKELVEVGAHSLSHRSLVFLNEPERKEEVNSSRAILEDKLHRKVRFFSYPFGAADPALIRMVEESGFEAAVGTAYPLGEFNGTNAYLLRRVFVSRSSAWPFVFRFMSSGYYIPARELFLRVFNLKVPRDKG